jgi:hypothetical protein
MKIHGLMNNIAEELYFDHDFRNILEDHLTYLKVTNSRVLNVTEHQNYKWEGDFFGLLDELKIPKEFHYLVMRMNGLQNSAYYKGDISVLLIPDIQEVENLKTIHQTKNI